LRAHPNAERTQSNSNDLRTTERTERRPNARTERTMKSNTYAEPNAPNAPSIYRHDAVAIMPVRIPIFAESDLSFLKERLHRPIEISLRIAFTIGLAREQLRREVRRARALRDVTPLCCQPR